MFLPERAPGTIIIKYYYLHHANKNSVWGGAAAPVGGGTGGCSGPHAGPQGIHDGSGHASRQRLPKARGHPCAREVVW